MVGGGGSPSVGVGGVTIGGGEVRNGVAGLGKSKDKDKPLASRVVRFLAGGGEGAGFVRELCRGCVRGVRGCCFVSCFRFPSRRLYSGLPFSHFLRHFLASSAFLFFGYTFAFTCASPNDNVGIGDGFDNAAQFTMS